MRVLITGGCGLVGIHTALAFARSGFRVVCLDRFAPGPLHEAIVAEQASGIDFVTGDIRDRAALLTLMRERSIEGVVHGAALINESYARRHPLETHEVNVGGTAILVEAMRDADVRRLVFTSSATVYGPRTDGAPIRESEPRPDHVYGFSKYIAEQWVQCYARVYGLHATIVRLSSVFGPGKAFNPDRYPKQALCVRAIRGERFELPEGGDYARDFTYAADAARGILLAYRKAPVGSGPFNIASGRLFTLREVASALNRLYPAASLSVARGKFESNIALSGSTRGPLDISRARDELGFQPEFDLPAGLKHYCEFLRTFQLPEH